MRLQGEVKRKTTFLVLLLAVLYLAASRPVARPHLGGASGDDVDSLNMPVDGLAEDLDSLLTTSDGSKTTVDSMVASSVRRQLTVDSVLATYNEDSILTMLREGRIVEVGVDSSKIELVKHDTIAVSKGALDEPVFYTAKDSITFDYADSRANLYGESKVNYQNLELTADLITMSLDSSLVHAMGREDSTGVVQGKPVFRQGEDAYEPDKISYNFKSQKAFIQNVYTEQGEGYLISEDSKRDSTGVMYLQGGKYTTCDADHPHFYLRLTKAKVRPGQNVVFGPAYLVVEDVPLPLAIPYGFFPFSKKYSSGFIMPTYGDETRRGFYLRDGGYYFAVSDKMDLKVLGEIYTKGSWGLSAQSNYRRRYRYAGNYYFSYQNTKEGEKNMPDYAVSKSFKLTWSHRQDAKANPAQSFSASVNFATSSYERNNLTSMYNPESYTQSTRTSSVAYSRSFQKIGLTLSGTFNLSQNMRDSSIAVTLPSLNISLSRFYPFKRKKAVGKERWYEKIAVSYTGTLSNSISTKENKLLKSNLIKDWKNGMKHSIPVSASFNVLKYINVTPSLNYTERWYTNKIEQMWDESGQQVLRDTIYGFNRVFDYNLSLSANTKLYGMYKPNPKVFGKKLQMVRHVLTPSVSFTYAPDFGDSKWGYWKTYTKTDEEGNVSLVSYSPYAGSLYGTPSQGKTGSVNFGLSNNIEAKIKDRNDSIKKVSIIDELGANISYNLAAKTQPWSNLSTSLRLKWGKTTFNMNAVFNTYAYEFDKNGNVIVGNRTEWSYGRFGRFQGMSKNLSYTFNNQTFKKLKDSIRKLFGHGYDIEDEVDDDMGDDNDLDDNDLETNIDNPNRRNNGKKDSSGDGLDEDGYMKFQMPWSFSISYGITMAEDRSKDINVKNMRYPYKFTQNLNFSGNLKLASNWNCSFSSGWDFTNKAISMTTVNISRDMHCFNVSCGLVFGTFTSYHITMRANASTLTDALKYDKKSSYSSSIQWY